MLLRFDPFRELDRLADQVATTTTSLPMDAVRRGDHVVVDLDLPGVAPESIDVTVERNVLTIRAERGPDRAEGDQVIASERRHGTLSRQLLLGDVLDGDAVEADYDRGVLRLRIPVAQTAKPRKVAVGAGGSAAAITAG